MAGLGILLIILGFGSLILAEFDYEFRLLSWAEDMQPAFGIILGIVGVLVLVAAIMMNRKKAATPPPSNGQWGQPAQGPAGPYAGDQSASPQGSTQFGGPYAGSQPPLGRPDSQGQPGPQGQAPQGQHAAPPPAQAPPQFGERNPNQP